jgi:hypothetical protein
LSSAHSAHALVLKKKILEGFLLFVLQTGLPIQYPTTILGLSPAWVCGTYIAAHKRITPTHISIRVLRIGPGPCGSRDKCCVSLGSIYRQQSVFTCTIVQQSRLGCLFFFSSPQSSNRVAALHCDSGAAGRDGRLDRGAAATLGYSRLDDWRGRGAAAINKFNF